ncbi:MAG: cation diffusion facilitator family transporter [Alphaproteobacteria bacterium]|nr:cation diffusion facilitator family transporter [Alphaproteobacteria bacterium]
MAAPSSKAIVYAAFAGNGLIAVTKFAAAAFTGSSAMLAEAIHSAVDTCNQSLLLIGMRRAARPADARHPFGYGAEIYFWAFVVAVLIFGVGAGVSIYEGVSKLSNPHPVENIYINFIVLGFAFVFEAGVWWYAWKGFSASKGRVSYLKAIVRSKDPTIFTVLLEDTAAMLGIIVAFLGILLADLTGQAWLDAAASIVIGLILAAVATLLAYETKGLLIGEAAAPSVVRALRKIVGETEGVSSINELRTLHFGPTDILVAISVDFADAMSSRQVEKSVTAIETAIKQDYPSVTRVFVEAQSPKEDKASGKSRKTRKSKEP